MLFRQMLRYFLVMPLQRSFQNKSLEAKSVLREIREEGKEIDSGGIHPGDPQKIPDSQVVPGGTQSPEEKNFAASELPNSEEDQKSVTLPGVTTLIPVFTTLPPDEQAARRYTKPTSTTARRTRTKPIRLTFTQDCDNLVYYCMQAYNTGRLCGRSLFFMYHDFQNYCMLDYVNCLERYQYWQVVHMGECVELETLEKYRFYPYKDDSFLHKYHADSDEEF